MGTKVLYAPKGNFGKLLAARKGYLASVYSLLAIQLAITSAVVVYLRKNPDIYEKVRKLFWLWFVLSLVLIFVIVYFRPPMIVRLAAFTAFSILIGLNMLAASNVVPQEAIKAALLATLAIFILMTVLGYGLASMGINIGFMAFTLTFCLLALIIAWLVVHFVGGINKQATKALLFIGVVLFSIFICFDTNALLLNNQRDTVDGAIGLYLDLINLFSNMLGIDIIGE